MEDLLTYLATVNLMTYIAFIYDKRAAHRHAWRIPEKSLQLLAILGGSPAALLASRFLHHKNRKPGFQLVLMLIFMVQLLVLAAYITNPSLFATVAPAADFIKKS